MMQFADTLSVVYFYDLFWKENNETRLAVVGDLLELLLF